MAPGCKPGGLRLYVGSNPTPSTITRFITREPMRGPRFEVAKFEFDIVPEWFADAWVIEIE
jgi:hypothetical protein